MGKVHGYRRSTPLDAKTHLLHHLLFGVRHRVRSTQLATSPHVFDNFPDSHTYLTVSFLGHAERLWTIPVVYFFGASSAGRVILQIAIA